MEQAEVRTMPLPVKLTEAEMALRAQELATAEGVLGDAELRLETWIEAAKGTKKQIENEITDARTEVHRLAQVVRDRSERRDVPVLEQPDFEAGAVHTYRTDIKGQGIRTYDPAKSRNWKAEAKHAMLQALTGPPFTDGPLAVRVVATFSCPRSQWRKRSPWQRRWHAKRPDGENVAKAVLDAATGILWADDAQVARLEVEKWIGAQGEMPGVWISVERLA